MRYGNLDAHADAGLGADELGTARLTRPCERIEHHHDVVTTTQKLLDAAADRLWRRMDDNRDHPQFDEYRRRAFAAKDRADEYRRKNTPPAGQSRQETGRRGRLQPPPGRLNND